MISFATYFELILAVSLWELGIFTVTRKGKIFDFVNTFFEKFPDKISDPIITCITCMSSLHTFIWVFFFLYIHPMFNVEANFWIWMLVAIPCSYVNTVLWQITELFEQKWKILNRENKKHE